MNAVSPSRPISWIVTMFGWFNAEAARASCSKREIRSRSLASASGRTLSATSRPSRVSRAAVNLAHPSGAQGCEDFVEAEPGSGRNGHELADILCPGPGRPRVSPQANAAERLSPAMRAVRRISASPCAVETNQASNCAGGRKMPRSRMAWKNTA